MLLKIERKFPTYFASQLSKKDLIFMKLNMDGSMFYKHGNQFVETRRNAELEEEEEEDKEEEDEEEEDEEEEDEEEREDRRQTTSYVPYVPSTLKPKYFRGKKMLPANGQWQNKNRSTTGYYNVKRNENGTGLVQIIHKKTIKRLGNYPNVLEAAIASDKVQLYLGNEPKNFLNSGSVPDPISIGGPFEGKSIQEILLQTLGLKIQPKNQPEKSEGCAQCKQPSLKKKHTCHRQGKVGKKGHLVEKMVPSKSKIKQDLEDDDDDKDEENDAVDALREKYRSVFGHFPSGDYGWRLNWLKKKLEEKKEQEEEEEEETANKSRHWGGWSNSEVQRLMSQASQYSPGQPKDWNAIASKIGRTANSCLKKYMERRDPKVAAAEAAAEAAEEEAAEAEAEAAATDGAAAANKAYMQRFEKKEKAWAAHMSTLQWKQATEEHKQILAIIHANNGERKKIKIKLVILRDVLRKTSQSLKGNKVDVLDRLYQFADVHKQLLPPVKHVLSPDPQKNYKNAAVVVTAAAVSGRD